MDNIIKWWASNPVAANLLMLAFLIAGLVSYIQIERELTHMLNSRERRFL
jgi:multidrug efflux pump subunit AcrB